MDMLALVRRRQARRPRYIPAHGYGAAGMLATP
jgi:hypothetical protein